MLVITDQDPTALRQPRQRPLDDPPAGFTPTRTPVLAPALPDRADVVDILLLLDPPMPGGGVIPLVQARVLLEFLRVGAFEDYRLDRRFQQFPVQHVGPVDHDSQ